MRTVTVFNGDWLFEGKDEVCLPHTAVELPFSYFDEKLYQREFKYEKIFWRQSNWEGKEISVLFEAVMSNAKVFLNGEFIGGHKDGYTPFEIRLTEHLENGQNKLTVIIDGSENPNIPPFGGRIDYLTFAGIYRDVFLKVTEPLSIGLYKVETLDAMAATKSVAVTVEIDNPRNYKLLGQFYAEITDLSGDVLAEKSLLVDSKEISFILDNLINLDLWDIQNPVLYTLKLRLDTDSGRDTVITQFGFRTAEFTPDGFFLNGREVKIRGLNRHQSYPYSGYALGKNAQERDAEILKNDLKLNLVRTSHYPQSKWFLDHCDRIGLLVFEEIPGWQHIGEDDWKTETIENVGRMIRRDWNHPSIILWGVRINESNDDDALYTQTNRVAHELDPTRQTAGVRYISESNMLEDVYTMNDFILGDFENGGNRPRTALRSQKEITGLSNSVPYLVTEFNGHMFPTKSTDQEQRQAEHVIRHLEVLDAAYGDDNISGAIGWCAFDYNTHKDFGSGDRICHHGVMDMFREPKFAAYAYASQCEPSDEIILKTVTFWARGERNIGGVLPLIVLTNCEEIEFRYGDHEPKMIKPDRERFPNLPNAPVIIDRRHFSEDELGQWGMKWEDAVFTGYIDGKLAVEQSFTSEPVPTVLEVKADMVEIDIKSVVRVIVRVLDQAGNKLPFFPEPVTIDVSGAGRRIGPRVVPLRAGSTGFWVQSEDSGPIKLSVSHDRLGTVVQKIQVRLGVDNEPS